MPLRSGYIALASVVSNGQSRMTVALAKFLVKNLVSTSFGAGPHQRVTGKKGVIPGFPQEKFTELVAVASG
jgi:hypothetical protein